MGLPSFPGAASAVALTLAAGLACSSRESRAAAAPSAATAASRPEAAAPLMPGLPVGQDGPVVPVVADRAALQQLIAQVRQHGRIRVILELSSPELEQMDFPVVEERDRERIEAIRASFLQSLGLSSQGRDPRVVRRQVSSQPLVFLSLTKSDLEAMALAAVDAGAGLPPNSVTFRIERAPDLREERAPAATSSGVDIAEILSQLDVTRAHAAGLEGDGGTIVVIDTGVQHHLPDLAPRMRASYCAKVEEPIPGVLTDLSKPPEVRCSGFLCHGSEVAWLASRVAPRASLVAIRADDMADSADVVNVPIENILVGLDDVLRVWRLESPPARVVNISLAMEAIKHGASDAACELSDSGGTITSEAAIHISSFAGYATRLLELNVPVVVAAGNDDLAPGGSIAAWPAGAMPFPGCVSPTVSVAGTEPTASSSGGFVARSSPSNWCEQSDLAAPAAFIDGVVAFESKTEKLRFGPGTSMAAPFVSGALALLHSPERRSSEVVHALIARGKAIVDSSSTTPPVSVTVPQPQVMAAHEMLRAGPVPIETLPLTDPTPGGG